MTHVLLLLSQNLLWTDQVVAEEICEHFGPRGLKLLWQDIIRRTQGTRLCLHPILKGRGISGHWRGYVGKDQDQEESSA